MSMTNAQLADLARFGRLPEGKVFVDHLKMRLAEHDKALRTVTGEELFRTQGKAQALEQIIRDIEGAETSLMRAGGSLQRPRAVTM